MEKKKQRQSNMELLRIIAMLMVISLHYLDKGGLLKSLGGELSIGDYGVWLLESFCIVAVNVYVLISGYFMIDAQFTWKKVVTLWLQILFYTVLVPVVLIMAGILPVSNISINQIFYYIFPVTMNHYWFATAYIILLILSPFLSLGMKAMNQKQHGSMALGLLFIFSVLKTFLPVKAAYDTGGNDVLWFICLYVFAGYIKLYGLTFFSSLKKSLLAYVVLVFGIFSWMVAMKYLTEKIGIFTERMGMSFEYNHLLVLLASVALFYTFIFIKKIPEKTGVWINRIASGTFGVYLLHEQIELRFLWPEWLGLSKGMENEFSIFHYAVSVLLVFLVGTLVDLLRQWLFRTVSRLLFTGMKRGNANGN